MIIVKQKKYFYSLSIALTAASLIMIAYFGLPFGIDFNGGSVMEIRGTRDVALVSEVFESHSLNATIQSSGDNSLILRFEEVSEEQRRNILVSLQEQDLSIQQDRFESVGPVIGKETKQNSLIAIVFVFIAIVVYIAWAFRKFSYPVASWKYGMIALVALFHDIIITVGVVVLLANVTGRDVGVPFIAGLLTVLGYSVNDTIVVFDRARENVKRSSSAYRAFSAIVEKSVQETLVRSLNSSLTTVSVLVAIFIFGGESLFLFMATLIVGVIVGTYSSIALAGPMLATLADRVQRSGKQ